MSTCRPTSHSFALATLAAVGVLLGSSPAGAGCLDCLFGRSNSYSANYPYAGYGYQPYGLPGYNYGVPAAAPAVAAPVYPPQTLAPPTLYAPSAAAPVTPSPITPSPMATSGVVQAQRPAYSYASPGSLVPGSYGTVQSFDNPSVYTGLPVTAGMATAAPQTAYRLPLAGTTEPLNTSPGYSYSQPYVTANRVPIAETLRGNAGVNPILPSTYSAYSPAVAPVNYNAPVTNYAPAANYGSTQVLPLAARPQRTFGSGLSRFFNSMLGNDTNYTSSYYSAPITYYRPLSSVDPVSGTTVTVQQPCSSYVQQLQRVPYNSFQPPQTAPIAPPQFSPNPCPTVPDPCAVPIAGTPGTFSPPGNTPGYFGQSSFGDVAPVGGYSNSGDPGATLIPSTVPPSEAPAIAAPLTGSDSPAADPSDQQRVPQPRLESERPPINDPVDSDSTNSEGATNNPYEQYYRNPNTDSYRYDAPAATEPDDADASPIQLDPPVLGQTRGANPSDLNQRDEQFTTNTPPQYGAPQYSTLRPIGVPTQTPTAQTPAIQTPAAQPQTDVIAPPLLPPPSQPAPRLSPSPTPNFSNPSSSNLFRGGESSAAARSPQQYRVSAPVREATLRGQSVRQVAAWEDAQPASPPRPPAIKRDSGGWLPAR
ncbi:hypothetical protein NHH03_18675 [Stieleria sp. TO1_6]|uniref:hypothetical protein n=1 Tax=Stieleria tagensis TaxID=2956795 RepID=UPI00209B6A3C|nr:hypothetical protein [Stieleria tagensis]MCO8123777.1 hypothetical protein [Stieleria tagensis]